MRSTITIPCLFLIGFLSGCGGGSKSDTGNTGEGTPVIDDTTPDNFTFSEVRDADIGAAVQSEVSISGLSKDTAISIVNGEYSLDDGLTFTSQDGMIGNQNLVVRRRAASIFQTGMDAVVTVGGVARTFSVYTEAAPSMPLAADINFDITHYVGDKFTFDRSKFIVLHASINDNAWDSDQQRDTFLEDYNVYLGRNNGAMPWQLSRLEGSATGGRLDLDQMTVFGDQAKGWYRSDTGQKHEHRASNMMFGGQPIMYPMNEKGFSACGGNNCKGNLWLADFNEGARFYSEWLTRYFGAGGDSGEMKPALIEVLNEPFVHANEIQASVEDISEFHSLVANRIHQDHPEVKVGGYTAAWPQFESNNFNHWENNWKKFIDIAGDDMDFYSIHIYDGGNNGEPTYRSGSNAEALLDMIEHYSLLADGETKPFVISEYGHFDRPITNAGPYSKERDWLGLRSFSSQMVQFMERPDQILSAIPFMVLKGLWIGEDGLRSDGSRYGPRLLRLADEISGELYIPDTGDWVYTEFLQFFKLWSDVNGTRIETKASDPDLQVDAYLNGDEAYIILNNLEHEDKRVALNFNGLGNRSITHISSKHIYQDPISKEPVFDVIDDIALSSRDFDVGYQATKIIKISFSGEVLATDRVDESKHYADKYKQVISAGSMITFSIDGISKNTVDGEAVLRLGLGRQHGLSLQPTIRFNNHTLINVPSDFRGYDQQTRDSFLGVIEIPVPYESVQENNSVSIEFEDGGGYVSSLSLQLFRASKPIDRFGL